MLNVVISGVNLKEGGILSVLHDCLGAFKQIKESTAVKITVLVHSKELVEDFLTDFNFEEYPDIKRSWLKRIKFEYFDCLAISNRLCPDLWISLHDMSPRVNCKYQVVYCHNTSSFFKLKTRELFTDFKFFLFNKLYKYLYAINIKSNQYVILQQQWLRKEFEDRYGVLGIVAQPNTQLRRNLLSGVPELQKNANVITFFYPSFPRVFKNFEILLQVADELYKQRQDFEVLVTFDGSENEYSKTLYEKYKKKNFIKFLGLITRQEVYTFYKYSDCLIFPSRLESWGLPISEFKEFEKPILCADLPYAHETVGNYSLAKFFDPYDPETLKSCMEDFCSKKIKFDNHILEPIPAPFFEDWNSLLKFLILDYNKKFNNG